MSIEERLLMQFVFIFAGVAAILVLVALCIGIYLTYLHFKGEIPARKHWIGEAADLYVKRASEHFKNKTQ